MITHVVVPGSATPPSQWAGTAPKFWDIVHVHTLYEKQQTYFAGWSN